MQTNLIDLNIMYCLKKYESRRFTVPCNSCHDLCDGRTGTTCQRPKQLRCANTCATKSLLCDDSRNAPQLHLRHWWRREKAPHIQHCLRTLRADSLWFVCFTHASQRHLPKHFAAIETDPTFFVAHGHCRLTPSRDRSSSQ